MAPFVLDPFQTIVGFNLGPPPSTEDPPSEYEWIIRVGIQDIDPSGPFTVTFSSSVSEGMDLVDYLGAGEDEPESKKWDLYGLKYPPTDTDGNPIYYTVRWDISGSTSNPAPGIELQAFIDVQEGTGGPTGGAGIFETPFSKELSMVPDGMGGWTISVD